jgi:hypothetical protein
MTPMTPKQRRARASAATARDHTHLAEIKRLQGRLGATEARRKEAHESAIRFDHEATENRRRELAFDELAATAIQALNNPMIPLRVREMTVDGLQLHLRRLRDERVAQSNRESDQQSTQQQATDPDHTKGRPL